MLSLSDWFPLAAVGLTFTILGAAVYKYAPIGSCAIIAARSDRRTRRDSSLAYSPERGHFPSGRVSRAKIS